AEEDLYKGRAVHLRFDTTNTITGTYTVTELATDPGDETPMYDNYQSVFVGAAIGEDDTIVAAFNNSVEWNTPNTASIAVKIYDPSLMTWTYEQVASGMASQLAYPFAFVSDDYFHVYAVEDQYDPYYETAGTP